MKQVMKIANLTQHNATPEQVAAGVEDLPAMCRTELASLLTFEEIPDRQELAARAIAVITLATALDYEAVMIGGAPFFMAYLETAAKTAQVACLYAFSKRESAEHVQADGSVRKVNVFRHVGFVEA